MLVGSPETMNKFSDRTSIQSDRGRKSANSIPGNAWMACWINLLGETRRVGVQSRAKNSSATASPGKMSARATASNGDSKVV